MDSQTTLFRTLVVAVVAHYIGRLLDYVGIRALFHLRRSLAARRHHTRIKHDSEQAVSDALEAWDYAEYGCDEQSKRHIVAHEGQNLTVNDKAKLWQVTVEKCIEAATLLEQSNEAQRASVFRNNSKIAARHVQEFENRSVRTRKRIVGTNDEAKRSEYDAELAESREAHLLQAFAGHSTTSKDKGRHRIPGMSKHTQHLTHHDVRKYISDYIVRYFPVRGKRWLFTWYYGNGSDTVQLKLTLDGDTAVYNVPVLTVVHGGSN